MLKQNRHLPEDTYDRVVRIGTMVIAMTAGLVTVLYELSRLFR